MHRFDCAVKVSFLKGKIFKSWRVVEKFRVFPEDIAWLTQGLP